MHPMFARTVIRSRCLTPWAKVDVYQLVLVPEESVSPSVRQVSKNEVPMGVAVPDGLDTHGQGAMQIVLVAS